MKSLFAALTMLGLAICVALVPVTEVSSAGYDAEGKYKRIKPARPLEQTDKVDSLKAAIGQAAVS